MNRPAVIASLLLLSGGTLHAQDENGATVPMVVTTDTSSYCQSLWQQIRERGTLPRDVRELQTEGRDLCQEGQVRGGINRLRRALMMLRAQPGASDTQTRIVGDPSQPAATAGPHG